MILKILDIRSLIILIIIIIIIIVNTTKHCWNYNLNFYVQN